MTQRTRNWCFTDYDLSIIRWKEIYENNSFGLRGVKFGEEICPTTGKKHLQGFMQFEIPKTFFWVQKRFEPLHVGPMYAKEVKAAVEYCEKEATTTIFGRLSYQGKRTDLEDLMHGVEEQKTNLELCYMDPVGMQKYYRFIIKFRQWYDTDMQNKKLHDRLHVNLWENQIKWLKLLEEQNDRQILWIYDEKGGTGKGEIGKQLTCHNDGVIFTNSKNGDIAYAYNYQKTVIFDFSRSLEAYVNYDVIEQLCNGVMFSKKYESATKIFERPKIIIMANFGPRLEKLTSDRWVIANAAGNTITADLMATAGPF